MSRKGRSRVVSRGSWSSRTETRSNEIGVPPSRVAKSSHRARTEITLHHRDGLIDAMRNERRARLVVLSLLIHFAATDRWTRAEARRVDGQMCVGGGNS